MGKSDILLVEDNPDDAELTLHAFRKHDMVDDIILVRSLAGRLIHEDSSGCEERWPAVRSGETQSRKQWFLSFLYILLARKLKRILLESVI